MTFINLESSKTNTPHPLGDLTTHITNDGSLSLRNSYYKESFHSLSGAKKESKEKFLYPSQVNRFFTSKELRVLDVCLGLGYNSACLIESVINSPITLNLWGLELDQRPLRTALENPIFRKSWSKSILEILKSINNSGKWQNDKSHGNMVWGDARQKLTFIPKDLYFDLIFLDAFSPVKCPQLWSDEFLHDLADRLAPNGRIITYSSSAAIRGSLQRAGLRIYSIIPTNKEGRGWSAGTIGIRESQAKNLTSNSTTWRTLSNMEKEHLLTSAAVPYRDPTRTSTNKEIIYRRKVEQENSQNESTSSWKKRWDIT